MASKREKALRWYKVLAAVTITLAFVCVVCALVGELAYKIEDDNSLPYHIGGFLVAPVALIHTLLSVCIFMNGKKSDANGQCGVACTMIFHWILAMFLFITCLIGLVFAGFGGFNDNDSCSECRTISAVLLICFICLVICGIVTIVLVCVYGGEFGAKISPARRHHRAALANTSAAPTHVHNTNVYTTNTTNVHVGHLQERNRLLQQQVLLQQQLLNQQQQQTSQHGMSEPPPPYSSVSHQYPEPSAPQHSNYHKKYRLKK